MASLINPELMAQLMLRQQMPNTVNTGMGQALPPPTPQPGLLAAHQQARMQAQPTPPGGPRGAMAPMNETLLKERLLAAYGITDDAEKEKWKDVPFQQMHGILNVQAQQQHQRALLEQQQRQADLSEQRYQQGQQHTRMREELADKRYAAQQAHQKLTETEMAFRDRQAQVNRLQAKFDKETDPDAKQKLGNDLMAAKQEVMGLTRRRDQLLPQGEGQSATAPQQSQQFREGMTATGPNGHRIVFKNGQWVPLG